MKRVWLAAIAASALVMVSVMPAAAHAQMMMPQMPPSLNASGSGEAYVTPDRATIYVGVQSRATTAQAASADNARRQRAVLDTLRALGFTSDQLSTMNYSVSPEMASTPNNAPRVTGYVVMNTVRVEARKIDEVSRAIDASLAKGANEISGLEFYSSKADSARHAAMAQAVANAKADAEAMARAAGGSVGPLLELSSNASTPIRFNRVFAAAAPMAAPTPIEPGQQTITVTVTGRWSYVSK